MLAIHPEKEQRIATIDILRGLVMVIMALDHVRDFFHETALTDDPLNLVTTTPPLFFTRWITHFCAPVFVALSGVSAYLSGRQQSRQTLSRFLIKRGLWLVIVDLVIMSFALSFNPAYNFVMLTVLWAIGWSMVLLGLLLLVSSKVILPVGLLLFFGHNLLTQELITAESPGLVRILFVGRYILPLSPDRVFAFFYAILPWTGVMLLGYWMGQYVGNRKVMLVTSLLAISLFLLLRFMNLYGDPQPWSAQTNGLYTVLSFLNTTKYPPSLLFLLMTLGPAMVVLALPLRGNSIFEKLVTVYGRVPFFYYIVHFFLAHLLVVGAFYLTGHNAAEIRDPASPFLFRPAAFGFSLPVVYGVWLTVVVVLYYPCKWFYRYKKAHRKWWLRYV